jgi:hypothetical protein
VRYS